MALAAFSQPYAKERMVSRAKKEKDPLRLPCLGLDADRPILPRDSRAGRQHRAQTCKRILLAKHAPNSLFECFSSPRQLSNCSRSRHGHME